MRRTLIALALCASFTLHAEETAPPQVLEVSLNQRPTHQVMTFYPGVGGELFAKTEDWKELGVVLSKAEEAKPRLSTAELQAHVQVNEDAQTVEIELPSSRLPKQDLSNAKTKQTLAEPAKALLVNYNVSGTKSFPGDYMGVSLGHDLHLPVFGGVVSTSGQLNYNTTQGTEYRRLYSTWERDNYSKLQSIQVGDVFAYGPGAGATTTNLAGVRWAKDPAGLDPSTPTFPLPSINGLAVDAGTLAVLANQSPLLRGAVDKGPFQIDQIQAQAGLNVLQAVVQDGYGRQTVINAGSYYVSPSLLRAGMDTWDISAGLIRRDYTDTYRGFGANARYAKGLTDSSTFAVQAQAAGDGENLSGTWVQKLGNAGVLTSSIALSDSHRAKQAGFGWYGSIGYEFHTANWGVHFQRYQSDNFYQLHDPSLLAYQPKASTLLGASWTSENRRFSAQLNYNDLTTSYSRYRQVIGGLSWGAHGHHLNLSAGYDLTHHTPSFMLTYNYTFGHAGISASVGENNGYKQEQLTGFWNHNTDTAQFQSQATLIKNPASTMGLFNSSLFTNRGAGTLNLESDGQNGSVSGSWSGSAVLTPGGLGWTKNSPSGYVVVDVPGVGGVPVTQNGRVVASTNSSGVAVIGQVQSPSPVTIGLKDQDIPLGVDIANTSKTIFVPKVGGAHVQFDVETMEGRAFHLTNQGKDVPMGSTTESGDVVGFGGALYLEHTPIGNSVAVTKPDGSTCKVTFPGKLPKYGAATDIECK